MYVVPVLCSLPVQRRHACMEAIMRGTTLQVSDLHAMHAGDLKICQMIVNQQVLQLFEAKQLFEAPLKRFGPDTMPLASNNTKPEHPPPQAAVLSTGLQGT